METKKERFMAYIQTLGRSLFLPISLLPVAGLLLGLGSSFTNKTTIAAYNLEGILGEHSPLHYLLVVMNATGNIILANLPLLFAMAIALGMSKREKEVAVLSSAIAFLVMNAAMGSVLKLTGKISSDGKIASHVVDGTITTVLGINTLQMGVFGGIIVGIGVAALHNHFYKQILPDAFSFFSGTRFVPIISTISYVGIGIILTFVWPVVQDGIYALGGLIQSSGYIGTFLYGALERLLIPFGLHHILNVSFWQTAIGGTAVVDGVKVMGCQNIFFAELASPTLTRFTVAGSRFIAGKYAFMIAGLPAACYAMYKTAKPENRKVVGSMLMSAAITSIVTGVTEPIEFTFLFVAPMLYGVHVVLGGFAFVIFQLLQITIGQTFSCGLIDFILYGILPGQSKTNWVMAIPVMLFYAVLYFVIFKLCIDKFNLPTPGREGSENKLYRRQDYNKKERREPNEDNLSPIILEALGGVKNVHDIDNCASRLRVMVNDVSLLNKELLSQTGTSGIVIKGNNIQVIYGPHVARIKSDLVDYVEQISKNEL